MKKLASVFLMISQVAWAHPGINDIPSAPHGAAVLSPIIGGVPVSCHDFKGNPVITVIDHLLPDVGKANVGQFPPVISMNPHVLLGMHAQIQLFWYGHECAHHLLPTLNEVEADCWSIRTGKAQGWFAYADLEWMFKFMKDNPGDFSHPPGEERAAYMLQCFVES